jgi:mRNA-degrading endonuclease RelE of RelBE toxin-antitoxin system
MKIKGYKTFQKAYRKLPAGVQERVDKQIELLAGDFRHPSLHTKKIKGREGIWEVRVDDFHRLTFEIVADTIFLRVVGNHDDVLKKP